MVTIFVKHLVHDYTKWKSGYDGFAPTRKALGVTKANVYRDVNNGNLVTVTHQFSDLATAKAFVDSEELKAVMMKAGVAGPPDVWFTEDVEQTPY